MRILSERKIVKRSRYHIDQEYVYYLGKPPKQVAHKLKLVDMYIALGRPEHFLCEMSIGNLRCDGYCEVPKDNKLHLFFIEIQQHHVPDYEKYRKLYESGVYKKYNTFPKIIIVSKMDLTLPSNGLRWYSLPWDIGDIGSVFNA